MATPTIRIDQTPLVAGTPGASRSDLALGTAVVATDPANGAGAYSWELVVPPGSSATLSGGSTDTATFTPDVRGTYLLYLQFDADKSWTDDADGNKISSQGGAGVKYRQGTRALGVGETFQFAAVNGWAEDFAPYFATIDAVEEAKGATFGAVFYADTNGDLARLAPGTSGQVLRTNGAAAPSWMTPLGASLQSSYDGGAAIFTAGGGPVAISRTAADTTSALTVSKAPTSAQAGSAFVLTAGANLTGPAMSIVNGGTGLALLVDAGGIGVGSGGASDPAIKAGVADPSAGGGVAAPEGSLYMRYVATAGEAWFKDGAADTAWTQVGAGGGGTLDAAYDFGGPGSGRAIVADSGAVTLTTDAIGASETSAFELINTTAAAAGAQQFSPMLVMEGQGWKTDATAASQQVLFAQQIETIQGTAAPTGDLVFKSSINAGAYTENARLTSGGQWLMPDGTPPLPTYAFAASPRLGMYAASSSVLRFASSGSYKLSMTTTQLLANMGASSTVPKFGFAASPGTGLGYPAINEASIVTGSTEAVRWDASQNQENAGDIAIPAGSTFYVETTSKTTGLTGAVGGINFKLSGTNYFAMAVTAGKGFLRSVSGGSTSQPNFVTGNSDDGLGRGTDNNSVNVIASGVQRQLWTANTTGLPASSIYRASVGDIATPTDLDEVALSLANDTAATVTVDQTSPFLAFKSAAWDSTAAASKDALALMGLVNTAGAGEAGIGSDLTFWSKVGASAYTRTAYLSEDGRFYPEHGCVVAGNTANPGLAFTGSLGAGLSYVSSKVQLSHGGISRANFDSTTWTMGIALSGTSATLSGDIDAAGGFRRTLDAGFLDSLGVSLTRTVKRDGTTTTTTDDKGWHVMARAGSAVELAAWADSDVLAGQMDFWVEISTDGGDTWNNLWGSSGAPVMALKSGGASAETTSASQSKDTSTFAAGDVLRIRAATNASFSSGRRAWCQLTVEC